MGLFGKKKEEVKTCGCGCGCGNNAEDMSASAEKPVKVLGSGCAKCNALEAAVKEALAQLGMDTEVEHVTDFAKIASYGVMSTPALVVGDRVVSSGRVLSADEVKKLLAESRG